MVVALVMVVALAREPAEPGPSPRRAVLAAVLVTSHELCGLCG